jgi:recX family
MNYSEEYDKAKSKVLKYILYKKRSKQEVKNKFSSVISNEMLEEIMDELEENGYINDNSYIERAVAEFIALNNLSLKEVKYKLMAKGISSSLIEDYISENEEKMQEYEINSAKNIIIKKQNQMTDEEIMTHLLKKGYKTSNIRNAIKKIDDDEL